MSMPPAAIGTIYCLHGHGEDHRFAFDSIHLHDVVAAAGEHLAVAAADGGTDSYWHRRADGRDPLAMLLEEFIPMVDARAGSARRALLGWSMGGYGALLAAATSPDRFSAVAVGSPALWTSPGATAPGAFDDADDYRRNDVFAKASRLSGLAVRLDCGRSDPFHAADRAFAARLPVPPQGTFGAGFHDAPYWRSIAPAQVATIAAAMRGGL
jgi:alpha-beta hydrolase superfamily lysophospholipase